MTARNLYVGTTGPFPYEDTVTSYGFYTDGQMYVGVAPTLPQHVLRLTDVTSSILGAALPISVATIAVVGVAIVGSREDHVHPGVDLVNAQTILGTKTLTSPIIADIAPGANFTLTQNGIAALTSINAGAIVNTLYLTAGKIGIKETTPEGDFHVKNASAGTVTASVNANLGIFEAGGSNGLSVLTPDGSSANLYLGSPTNNTGALVSWRYSLLQMQIGTNTASGFIAFNTGVNVEKMRLDSLGNLGLGVTPGAGKARLFFGGTATLTTSWALSAGWGANATVSAVTGTDVRGKVTVTTSVLDTPTAAPTLTLTFKDGTWTTTPFGVAVMDDTGTGLLGVPSCHATATTLVIKYDGTPTALLAGTYIFNYLVVG